MPFRMSYVLHLSDCVFMTNLHVSLSPVFFVNGKLKRALWLDTSKTLLARLVHGENWYFLLHFIYRISEGLTSKWCYRVNFVTVRTFHQKCMFPPLQLATDLWSDTKHYGTVLFPNISPESAIKGILVPFPHGLCIRDSNTWLPWLKFKEIRNYLRQVSSSKGNSTIA